jgi:uncharacterized protein YecT (DUF1311 family)
MRVLNLPFTLQAIWIIIGLLTVHCPGAKGADCKDATTTAAMRACENTRYQQSDQEMQVAYGQLMNKLEPIRKEKLRRAQRAWIVFRDANAEFLAGAAEDGTLAPLIRISALADLTEARTKELRQLKQ